MQDPDFALTWLTAAVVLVGRPVSFRMGGWPDVVDDRFVSRVQNTVRHLRGDLRTVATSGPSAPLRLERVWFDPLRCDRVDERFIHIRWSGKRMGGSWDRETTALEARPAIRACRLHWQHGVAWADTGIYEVLEGRIRAHGGPVDGCLTRADIVARYAALDHMFAEMQRTRRVLTRSQRGATGWREQGGIRISIDRDGRPVFAMSGHHRLAAARILGVRRAPAQVQVVHVDAPPNWRTA